MPSTTKTIDPADFLLNLGSVLIDGYADDSQVKITANEELFKAKYGLTGEVARMRNRNESAVLEITLMQTSASNDYLSARMRTDKLTGRGTFPVLGRDTRGGTEIKGNGCWIDRVPDIERGNEVKSVVWRIIIPKADINLGGNFENIDVA